MKKVFSAWLKNYAPTIWLRYVHRNQTPFFKFMACEYELRHINRIPISSKDVAIDIGANIGAYSFAFSKRLKFREIYSVEPDLSLSNYITLIPKVTLITKAISDVVSQALFSVPILDGKPLKSRSTLRKETLVNFKEKKTYKVNCTTLDTVMTENQIDPLLVGIIKIDVEGNEFQVLAGGKEFLTATEATLLIEIEIRHHPVDSVKHIFDFLLEFNYVAFYLCPVDGELKSLVMTDLQNLQREENVGTTNYVNNFIFIKGN